MVKLLFDDQSEKKKTYPRILTGGVGYVNGKQIFGSVISLAW